MAELNNDLRESYIEKLVSNLSVLRAKLNITQTELADMVGIGRQTLMAIENKKGKLRWDTFIALIVIFSKSRNK